MSPILAGLICTGALLLAAGAGFLLGKRSERNYQRWRERPIEIVYPDVANPGHWITVNEMKRRWDVRNKWEEVFSKSALEEWDRRYGTPGRPFPGYDIHGRRLRDPGFSEQEKPFDDREIGPTDYGYP